MGVTVTITSDGTPLALTNAVLSVEVRRDLNRIPEAYLTVADGSVARRRFEQSNAPSFVPGRTLTIAVRVGSEADATLFTGLVIKHSVESRAGSSVLRVELKDPAFKLTRQRRSAVHRTCTDGEVIETLIGNAGLVPGTIATTGPKHDELVQYHVSDWDFLVSRADAQGLVVDVNRGTVSVRAMIPSTKAKARLEHGLAPVELELELDGGEQWAAVTSQAWDMQTLSATDPVDASQPGVAVGNLDAAAIARTLGGDACALVHPAPLAPGELSAWAEGRLARSRLALLRGRVRVPGRADLGPLDVIELAGVGDRFNGRAVVSGVTHSIDHGGWRTELRLGLSPEPFARQADIADMPAGGLLPPVQGLHVGVVGTFEADPLGEHRVKVLLSVLAGSQGAVWARCARPDAGKQRGYVFWPEPGDEVVVGFLNGDPRQAIILGALHGKTNAPPDAAGPPSEKNPRRAFVSKGGTVIGFDDDKKAVTIETPGKNRIVIDDAAKSIRVADQHGNTLTLDANGITMKSVADLTIDASGKVLIKGSAVDVQ